MHGGKLLGGVSAWGIKTDEKRRQNLENKNSVSFPNRKKQKAFDLCNESCLKE